MPPPWRCKSSVEAGNLATCLGPALRQAEVGLSFNALPYDQNARISEVARGSDRVAVDTSHRCACFLIRANPEPQAMQLRRSASSAKMIISRGQFDTELLRDILQTGLHANGTKASIPTSKFAISEKPRRQW